MAAGTRQLNLDLYATVAGNGEQEDSRVAEETGPAAETTGETASRADSTSVKRRKRNS